MFMCVYLGVVHFLAVHAILVLTVFGGRDVVMVYTDSLMKFFGNACFEAVGLSFRLTLEPDPAPCSGNTLIFAALLWPISGLGITGGAHRLWAHRSYKAHWLTRGFLMVCNSIANQVDFF